jgi:hypothetical protein
MYIWSQCIYGLNVYMVSTVFSHFQVLSFFNDSLFLTQFFLKLCILCFWNLKKIQLILGIILLEMQSNALILKTES